MMIKDKLRQLAQEQIPVEYNVDDIPTAIAHTSEEDNTTGNIIPNSVDLEMNWGGFTSNVGIKFPLISIPAGANITNAYISFESYDTRSGTVNLNIKGEKGGTPADLLNIDFDLSDRTVTTATVAWNNIPSWTTNQRNADTETPDISAVIQEIIDDPGYTNGDGIVIILFGTSGTNRRSSKDGYNGGASGAPKLYVTYEI